QQLADWNRDLRREDQVMEAGVDQPGAEKMKRDFVRPLEICGLHLIETPHVLIEALAYELETPSQLPDLLGVEHLDHGEKPVCVESGDLIGGQPVARQVGWRIHCRETISNVAVNLLILGRHFFSTASRLVESPAEFLLRVHFDDR